MTFSEHTLTGVLGIIFVLGILWAISKYREIADQHDNTINENDEHEDNIL